MVTETSSKSMGWVLTSRATTPAASAEAEVSVVWITVAPS
jgi:hypothetical protein